MRVRRKRWEEIAETLIGVSGVVKYAGKNIPCKVKEVVIENNDKPELKIVTEEDKRYPVSRFTPSKQTKKVVEAKTRVQPTNSLNHQAEKLIKSGKGTLINRGNAGVSLYEVRLSPATSMRKVLFNEAHQKVIKVL